MSDGGIFTLNAREVRSRLKSSNVDPDVRLILEALAEDNSKLKQQILGLAQDMDKMTNILHDITTVGERMRSAVETVESMEPKDDGDDSPIR